MSNSSSAYFQKITAMGAGDRLNLGGLLMMIIAYIELDIMGFKLNIAQANEDLFFMAGFILTFVGMFLLIWKSYKDGKKPDQRSEQRDDFPKSERLQLFAKEVLSIPRTKTELSECVFDMYEGMLKHNLYGLLMQSTAKECVLSGLAKYQDGKYVSKDATEATVMVQS